MMVNELAKIVVAMEPSDIAIEYRGVMKFNFKLAIILEE